MNIISVPDKDGRLTGWLRDRPGVIAQGDNHVELMQNLINAETFLTEVEEEIKNEKK